MLTRASTWPSSAPTKRPPLVIAATVSFHAALVAWRMLENASETKKSPNAMRMGMRSNPFAAARLFVRMLRRAGLEADVRKTPERATVPCVVTVVVDGKVREVSMTMLRPVDAANVRRRHQRDDSQAA